MKLQAKFVRLLAPIYFHVIFEHTNTTHTSHKPPTSQTHWTRAPLSSFSPNHQWNSHAFPRPHLITAHFYASHSATKRDGNGTGSLRRRGGSGQKFIEINWEPFTSRVPTHQFINGSLGVRNCWLVRRLVGLPSTTNTSKSHLKEHGENGWRRQ